MNNDYIEEIRLSRALAREIGQLNEQYRNVVPRSVWKAYLKLTEHYEKEIADGRQ
jgi:hypothetical protein